MTSRQQECDGSGVVQIQVERVEPDCCGNLNGAGECRGDCAVPRPVVDTDFENCPGCAKCSTPQDEWVVCPRCLGEGEEGMAVVGERFVAGSGSTCSLCKGAQGFEDEAALRRAEAKS